MEVKELVPEGHFILERLVGGGFWKSLLPPALHLPKGWLSLTSILPGCSPPALSCSALLQGPVHPCPFLHELCFPGRLEGMGHGAMPHEACGPGLGVSSFCCPWRHSHFLSHTRCFPLVWQLHPCSLSLGKRNGAGEPAPALRGAWSQGCRHQARGFLGTGGSSLVHSLSSARATRGLLCYPLCMWFLPLSHGQLVRQTRACAIRWARCWHGFACCRCTYEGISGFIMS